MTHSEPGFAKANVADGRAQLQRLATDSWSRNTSLTAARDRGRAWRDRGRAWRDRGRAWR